MQPAAFLPSSQAASSTAGEALETRPVIERNLPSWVDVGGFVDIHCHLLPELDDGARDEETSRRMARSAYRAGTSGIVATPHCSLRYDFDPQLAAETLRHMEARFPGGLEVFTGCELELNEEGLRALRSRPRDFTLNRSRYVLVEWMHQGSGPPLAGLFRQLADSGLIPILAHPEKTPELQRQPERLVQWIELGGLVQITGDSLSGRMGRRARELSTALLTAELAHFVASDAHDATHRPPRLLHAYRRVRELAGPQTAARLFAWNPLAVVKDQPIE